MSLALCDACHRFARPCTRCPFCNAEPSSPSARPRGRRAARDGILAATAAISIACGGTIRPDDAGRDAAKDQAADVAEQDDGDIFQPVDDAGGEEDAPEEYPYPPPLPYGSPPIPRRVV